MENTFVVGLKKVFIKITKVLIWIIGGVFLLLLVLILSLQFHQTQTFLTTKIIGYVSRKTHSKLSLEEINISFPKYIVLKELYIEDQKKDTLLYSHLLKVDVDLWKLFSKKIEINTVVLEKLTGHVSRILPDSSFNFSFIPAAFADKGAEPAKKDTSKSTWQFSILEVRLKDIFLTYNDAVSGNDAAVKLGYFAIRMDAFDLNMNRYKVRNIELKNTDASLTRSHEAAASDTTQSKPLDFGLKEVLLSNINLNYEDKFSGQKAMLHLGKSELLTDKIDLQNKTILLKSFALHNSQIAFKQSEKKNEKSLTTDSLVVKGAVKAQEKGWLLALGTLDLKNNDIAFDDFNYQELKKGLDFHHMAIHDINIQIEKIKFQPAKTSATIHNLSFKDKSGFNLKHFGSVFLLDSVHTVLSGLDLQTGHSSINNYISLGYPSLASIGDSVGNLKVKVRLDKTKIAVADLLFFVPALSQQSFFAKNADKILTLNTAISGRVKDLLIDHFSLALASNTQIALKGSIKGLPAIDKTWFDILLSDFSTGRQDALAVLPSNSLPATINIPESVSVSGFFKGFIKNFSSELNLNSSLGKIESQLAFFPGKEGMQGYKSTIKLDQFDLGNLLKQPQNLGLTTLTASVEGAGLKPEEVEAKINLTIASAVLNKYPYKNFTLDGRLVKQRFTGKAAINDENLAFAFDGDLNLQKGQEQFDFIFNLKGAALQALKVSKDDIRVSGVLSSKIKGNQMNTMNGKVDLKKFIIIKNGKEYPVDSMFFVSVNGSGNSDLSFDSHMMSGKFSGNISLPDLPKVLKEHLDGYLSRKDPGIDKNLKPQNFKFEFILNDPSLLQEVLVPGLTELSPVKITGAFSSTEKKMDITVDVPLVNYTGTHIDSLSFAIHSDAANLKYGLRIGKIMNGTYKIENTEFNGKVEHDTVFMNLAMTRPDKTIPLKLSASLTNNNNLYKLVFNPQGFVLNNEVWSMPASNYLGFGKEFMAHDVKLSKGNSFIALNNIEEGKKAPLKITFGTFDLVAISKILEENNALITGMLDGDFNLDNVQKRPVFTSDIKVTNLAYLGKQVGDITLLADNKEADRYTVKLAISGNNNDIKADGFYLAKGDNENLNFKIHIHPLNLTSLQGFAQGQVQKLTGALAGDLTLTGSSKTPVLNGDLAFQKVSFTPTYTHSPLTLKDEHLIFNDKGINLKSFTFLDSLNNKASLNGMLLTTNFTEYKFDLDITTKNFLALNTRAGDNDLFFGKLLLDTKAHVTGSPEKPLINANVKILDGTSLTVIKPDATIAAEENKGIVDFFDPRKEKLHRIMEEGLRADTNTKKLTGIDLVLDLGITDKTQFKVIVDKASGDSLIVRGNSNLSVGLDPSGKTSLSGKYEITKGSYSLTVNDFIKREFEIGKGSSITWNGDPSSAEIDISAIYTAKTSPMALLEDQLSDMNEAKRNTFKRELPFQVYLYVRGDLTKPEISFGLQMPERYRGEMGGAVYARVQQINQDEAQLNQQVFALLVLDRFIANDPLTNPGGGGIGSSARSSVSKVLSDQLNAMSGRYIKGVDVNVNVESYEDNSKSGKDKNTTKVNYGVSKQLFNDKVKVQVGGNVDVEGTGASKNNLGNVAGDLSLEYKLSDDGRYLLRGLRKTQYEGAIEGELTRTGAAIVYVHDYNNFWDLFKKPAPVKPNNE
jgi:translocation and assembly module TamB